MVPCPQLGIRRTLDQTPNQNELLFRATEEMHDLGEHQVLELVLRFCFESPMICIVVESTFLGQCESVYHAGEKG